MINFGDTRRFQKNLSLLLTLSIYLKAASNVRRYFNILVQKCFNEYEIMVCIIAINRKHQALVYPFVYHFQFCAIFDFNLADVHECLLVYSLQVNKR